MIGYFLDQVMFAYDPFAPGADLKSVIEEQKVSQNGKIPDGPDPAGINMIQDNQGTYRNGRGQAQPECTVDLVAWGQCRG